MERLGASFIAFREVICILVMFVCILVAVLLLFFRIAVSLAL